MLSPENKNEALRNQAIQGLKRLDGFMQQTNDQVSPEVQDEMADFNNKLKDSIRRNMENRIGQPLPDLLESYQPDPDTTVDPEPYSPPPSPGRWKLPPRRF